MNKALMYISVWGLMVSATMLEIYIFTTSLSAQFKTSSIIALAISQALANAVFFQNLGYEKKIVSLLPVISLLALQTLLITAILSVGR
jgi:heme/copper-type cytochrome/quinol oxidase subunit 4